MHDPRSCTVAAALGGLLALLGPAAAPAVAGPTMGPAMLTQDAQPADATAEASTEANIALGLLAGAGAAVLGGGLFTASRRKPV